MKKHTLSLALSAAIAMTSINTFAHSEGDWIARIGATSVAPQEDSGHVMVNGVGNVGMGVEVDNNTQLGLNLAYMLTDNWAVEVLAATPFSHDITLVDTADNALGLGDGALASTKHLPPTISALYYFNTKGAFQPYVGAGINYTVFFDESFVDQRQSQSFSDLSLDASFGLAAQLGFDYLLDDGWFVNASVRYIDINTTADFAVLGTTANVDVDIDPLVYTLSLGFTF